MEPELDVFEQWAKEHAAKPWYKKIVSKISLKWEFEHQYLWRNFKTGVKNITYWLPIIWKDRNWDHRYIYNILQHKLKAQSKYIGNRGHHVTAKRDVEIMMTCVRLIDKVGDEFYSSEYWDYHKDKHWFEDIPGKEGYSSWESRILEENFNDYFKKYPLIHKRVLNGEGVFQLDGENKTDINQRIAMNIGHINHDRANKLLFKIMEENIQRWWD
jgi:hypothetical protein